MLKYIDVMVLQIKCAYHFKIWIWRVHDYQRKTFELGNTALDVQYIGPHLNTSQPLFTYNLNLQMSDKATI